MPASNADGCDVTASLRDEVRKMVLAALPAAHALGDDESLFAVAGFDSLTFIALLRAVEDRYGLSLSSSETALADFSSIESIASYVASREVPPENGEGVNV